MTNPRVSIGLPVYNGEKYLEKALDSLLSQTFSDFELIIADNASTDATESICQTYCRADRRIRYIRNQSNIGAINNFNLTFSLAVGEYFRWATYDDIVLPEYLQRCVSVLDNEPAAILCHPRTIIIDENGDSVGPYDDYLDFRSDRPHERFRNYLFRPATLCNAIMGVIRRRELEKTPLLGNHLAADKVLLGELALRGKFYRLDEYLFLRRLHPEKSDRANRKRSALAVWLNPANRGKFQWPTTIPQDVFAYGQAIRRAPISRQDKLMSSLHLAAWLTLRPFWSLQRRWASEKE